MARGKQFTQLIAGVRAELRRNNDPGVRASDLASIQQSIQRAYEDLYDGYDWAHLRRVFDKIPLSAGQRYYDFTTDMDFDRLEEVVVWFNELPMSIERGISLGDYASFNSEAATPMRADPVLKWDVRNVAGATQIEVWPIPDSNEQSLQFVGVKKFVQLVDDGDLCDLDDKLVELTAALSLETNEAGIREKAAALDRRLPRLKGRGKAASQVYRMGLGGTDADRAPARTTVIVSGG